MGRGRTICLGGYLSPCRLLGWGGGCIFEDWELSLVVVVKGGCLFGGLTWGG